MDDSAAPLVFAAAAEKANKLIDILLDVAGVPRNIPEALEQVVAASRKTDGGGRQRYDVVGHVEEPL